MLLSDIQRAGDLLTTWYNCHRRRWRDATSENCDSGSSCSPRASLGPPPTFFGCLFKLGLFRCYLLPCTIYVLLSSCSSPCFYLSIPHVAASRSALSNMGFSLSLSGMNMGYSYSASQMKLLPPFSSKYYCRFGTACHSHVDTTLCFVTPLTQNHCKSLLFSKLLAQPPFHHFLGLLWLQNFISARIL